MGRGTIVTKATHSAKDRTTYFIFTTWTRMSFLTYILWLKQGKISSTTLICDRQSQRLKVNLLCSKTRLYLEERKQEERSKKGMQWEKLGKACPRNELKLTCSFLERCWVHIETCDMCLLMSTLPAFSVVLVPGVSQTHEGFSKL